MYEFHVMLLELLLIYMQGMHNVEVKISCGLFVEIFLHWAALAEFSPNLIYKIVMYSLST